MFFIYRGHMTTVFFCAAGRRPVGAGPPHLLPSAILIHMKTFLFLELSVIFAASFLLTTQLFYNCLNEAHFAIIGSLGVAVAGGILLSGYTPSVNTLALYFILALSAFGYVIFTITVGYVVYNFGPENRSIFIEKEVVSILKSLPRHADRSKEKFGSYQFVCRNEAFSFVPGLIDAAHEAESCYGPLAFLIFPTDEPTPFTRYRCEADKDGWVVETNRPGDDTYLCIDARWQVVQNQNEVDGVACR